MILLDTDILIEIQRGRPTALAWFRSLAELPSVPGFVIMELIQGAQNARQVNQVLRLVAPLPVVWPSKEDCENALSIYTAFYLSHKIGLLDAMIGSCATGLSASLCTFNVKHYRVVPGLTLVQPYER